MSAALLLVLALAAEPADEPSPPAPATDESPAYPLGALAVPDFLAPGTPFTLTDLKYSMVDSGRAQHAFSARFRLTDLGYVGAEFEGDRQGVSLLTHRLSLAASTENGDWTLGAGWRARRFILSFDARSTGSGSSREWVLGPTLQVRLGPDVEVYAWAEGDRARPQGRFLTDTGVGAVWQRGAWLEATGELARTYTTTEAGDENRQDSARLTLVAQLGRAEVGLDGALDDVTGRFPRRESEVGNRLRLPLAARLLLEGGARARFDTEAGELRHEYRGALSWYGRRFTLPRRGQAARRAVELARRATELGEYELRAFDEDAQRAQRERLSLSPHAAEMADDMRAEYRAEVDERNVPLLGFEVRQRDDVFAGERGLALRATVGVPWPVAWPWRGDDAFSPFLRLDLEHEDVTTASSFRSATDGVALTVSLNREMDLLVQWSRVEPTALDVVRGIGVRQTLAVSYVYARGR